MYAIKDKRASRLFYNAIHSRFIDEILAITKVTWAFASAPGRNRTFNLRIKSPVLCQLSYGSLRGKY